MAHRVIALCVLLLGLAFGGAEPAHAQVGLEKIRCPDAKVFGGGLISKICWGAMFPLRIGTAELFHGKDGIPIPEGATDQWFCNCGADLSKGQLGRAGFTLGFWQPARAIEIVRQPYCMPLFGGLQLPIDWTAGGERQQGFTYEESNKVHTGRLGQKVFMNWNFYSFPVLQALKILDVPGCNPGGYNDFDLPLMTSAFFPNWYDNELAFFLNPDVGLLTIPAVMALQPMECAAVTATKQPVDKFWLTAGCWGNLVPYTGAVAPATRVKAWSLLSGRVMSMLSRLPGPMVRRTTGNDVLCEPTDMPILKKSQYKFSMLFPVPESRGIANNPPTGGDTTAGGTQVPELSFANLGVEGKSCAHPFGYPTALWGEWRSRPATGEDAVFLVWQWTDCCFGLISTP